MNTHHFRRTPLLLILFHITLFAQVQRDPVPLKSWPAPLYWQPTPSESQAAESRLMVAANVEKRSASLNVTTDAQTPVGALVFVAMTPCRIVDTRTGQGFTGPFGPPSLVGGVTRTFPIQSSTTCSIPPIAQGYSLNVTVVPPGVTFPGNLNPSGALAYLTIWPTGSAQPNASTLNSWLGTVVANAAIVPAGTSGSVNVFASNNTDLILDINGYYAPQSGITLAQGSTSAPALSFAGDPTTGIFSENTGYVDIDTFGTSRLRLSPTGDVTLNGQLNVSGYGLFQGRVGAGTTNPNGQLQVVTADDTNPGIIYNWDSRHFVTGAEASSGGIGMSYDRTNRVGYIEALVPNVAWGNLVLQSGGGSVGIGTRNPAFGRLEVDAGSSNGVFGSSNGGIGVWGQSLGFASATGVNGSSDVGNGVEGFSSSGIGVRGSTETGWAVWGATTGGGLAGRFDGNVYVTGTVTQNSDARLKERVANLSYGLPELMQLRPVTWTWKQKPEQGMQLGLIAQDVEKIVPELVSTAKDEEQTKGINYIGLVPVTIKAIQEQQKTIEQQQIQINQLKQLICAEHPQAEVCR